MIGNGRAAAVRSREATGAANGFDVAAAAGAAQLARAPVIQLARGQHSLWEQLAFSSATRAEGSPSGCPPGQGVADSAEVTNSGSPELALALARVVQPRSHPDLVRRQPARRHVGMAQAEASGMTSFHMPGSRLPVGPV